MYKGQDKEREGERADRDKMDPVWGTRTHVRSNNRDRYRDKKHRDRGRRRQIDTETKILTRTGEKR